MPNNTPPLRLSARVLVLAACCSLIMGMGLAPTPQRNVSSVYVRAEHLTELKAKFASNIRAYAGGSYAAIGAPDIDVRWDALKAIVPAGRPDSIDDYGLRFYFGLSTNNEFRTALEVVRMHHVPDKVEPYVNDAESPRMYRTVTISEALYIIQTNGTLSTTDRAAWMDGDHRRYMQNACIKRTDTDAELARFHKYMDPESEVFPWAMEIERMGKENNVRDEDLMTISCIGDNSGWMTEGTDTIGMDYHHALCLYFKGHIGDNVPTAPNYFQDHGANLGTLCPARCDLYIKPYELN